MLTANAACGTSTGVGKIIETALPKSCRCERTREGNYDWNQELTAMRFLLH